MGLGCHQQLLLQLLLLKQQLLSVQSVDMPSLQLVHAG
jgi:hypothetical protein